MLWFDTCSLLCFRRGIPAQHCGSRRGACHADQFRERAFGRQAGEFPAAGGGISQHHQIIPMHDFHALELSRADFIGAEGGEAAGEFGAVRVAEAYPCY